MTDPLDGLIAQAETDESELPTPAGLAAHILSQLPDVGGGLVVEHMSIDDRRAMVEAHRFLEAVERAVRDRRRVVELAFRRAAIALEADQVKVRGGYVSVVPSRGIYQTRADEMRRELLALTHEGHLTTEEVDDALAVTITTKPDHRRLNMLASHRGIEVAGAIERNREKVDGDPYAAKVTMHTKAGK